MNEIILKLILLKAFGLALLFIALWALPSAVGSIAAAFHSAVVPSYRSQGIDSFYIRSLFVYSGQSIVLGWVAIQVLKEKSWILRLTNIQKQNQSGEGTVGSRDE